MMKKNPLFVLIGAALALVMLPSLVTGQSVEQNWWNMSADFNGIDKVNSTNVVAFGNPSEVAATIGNVSTTATLISPSGGNDYYTNNTAQTGSPAVGFNCTTGCSWGGWIYWSGSLVGGKVAPFLNNDDNSFNWFTQIEPSGNLLSGCSGTGADCGQTGMNPAVSFVTGTWVHVYTTLNESRAAKLYVNGLLNASADGNYYGTLGNTALQIARRPREGDSYRLDGRMFDQRFFNNELSEFEILALYNNGNATLEPLSVLAPVPPQDGFRFSGNDNFTLDPLANFTVTVSNATNTTTYVGTTATLDVELAQGTYNINFTNIEGNTYFNVTDLSGTVTEPDTIFTFDAFQAVLNVTGNLIIINESVSDFNISYLGRTIWNSTGDLAVIHVGSGTQTLDVNVTGFFPTTIDYDLQPLAQTNFSFETWNATINITLYDALTNVTISNYTLLYTDIQTGTALSANVTGPTATNIPIISGRTYTVDALKTNVDVFPSNFTFLGSESRDLFSQSANSVNFRIFSEVSNQLFSVANANGTNITVNLELIGPTVLNATTNNGTLFVPNLDSGNYEVRYSANDFAPRSYFFFLPPDDSDIIDLYLLNNTVSTLVVVNIKDENDDAIEGAILHVLRFYASENAFKTVEMSRADFNGEAPINIVLDTVEYRFLVENNDVFIFDSETEAKITNTELRIEINLAGSPGLAFIQDFANTQGSLTTSVDDTNVTFTLTFASVSGFAQEVCLDVLETPISSSNDPRLCNICTTSVAGVLACNVNQTDISGLAATGTLMTAEDQGVVIGTSEIVFAPGASVFGPQGVFFGILILLGFSLLALWHTTAFVIAGGLAMALNFVAGTFVIGIGVLIGWMIGGLIIIFKGRQ